MSAEQVEAPFANRDSIERYIRERVELEVSETAPRIVAVEEDKRFSQLKFLIALISVVGLGTFGTLSNYLIEKAVDSKLEAKTGNISDAIDFLRFSSYSLKLEVGTSFSAEDRTAIMAYLRKASKSERVRYRPEFIASLTEVLKSFASAGQDSSINEIVELYEKELLNSNAVVEILLHHYGQHIVGRSNVPSDDQALRVFEKLEGVSRGANVPELALVYRALFSYRQHPSIENRRARAFLARASLLSEADRARFFSELFIRTRAENWQQPPNDEGRTFEWVTRGLLRDHAHDLFQHLLSEPEVLETVVVEGVDKELCEQLGRQAAKSMRPKLEPA